MIMTIWKMPEGKKGSKKIISWHKYMPISHENDVIMNLHKKKIRTTGNVYDWHFSPFYFSGGKALSQLVAMERFMKSWMAYLLVLIGKMCSNKYLLE